MGRYFMLRDGAVIEEPDYSTWARWYEEHYRDIEVIARTELLNGVVATRFLAINLSLGSPEEPLIFETRVSGGWLDDEWERFATIDEARRGHDAWVEKVRDAARDEDLPPPGAHW